MKLKIYLFAILLLLTYGCSSYNSLFRSEVRKLEQNDLKWGINGHSLKPDYSGYENQYNKFTYEEQIKFLNELNIDLFRFEIHADEFGTWNEKDEDLDDLISRLRSAHIEPIVVIITNLWRDRYAHEIYDKPVEIGEDWNYSQLVEIAEDKERLKEIQEYNVWEIYYQRAFEAGTKLALRHGSNIQFYNVGNEMARYVVSHFTIPECDASPPNWSEIRECFSQKVGRGNEYLQFFYSEELAKRFVSLSAYTKGFIDGIKANDLDAKIIINDTDMYYGYIQFLELLNVDYDIVGWNWYSGLGSIQNNLQNVNVYRELVELTNGKDIWITEFNSLLGSYYGEARQSSNIDSMIREYVGLEKIKALILYELIDQKYGLAETPYEDYFGLISAPFPTKKSAQPKPSFDVYRYIIEELQYGNEDFESSVLQDLFVHEKIDPITEKSFSELMNSVNKESVMRKLILASNLTSELTKETLEVEHINDLYNYLLKRMPLKKELRYWNRQLKNNPDINQMILEIILSQEYWENSVWSGYEKRTGFKRPEN